MSEKRVIALAILSGVLVTAPAFADVNIGVSIGAPAPPPALVVASPPQMVIVPSTTVHYVPSAGFNLFVYSGRYYSFHNGVWFIAAGHNGPWTLVAADRVPKPVLNVPVSYYKIPPGHVKKMTGAPGGGRPGHAKGPKGKKGSE